LLWSGTAASSVDLNSFLNGYSTSYASGIDSQGNVIGYAIDALAVKHAILWQVVPGAWVGGGSNDWTTTANWKSGTITTIPNGRGEPVVFGSVLSSGTADLMSIDRTVGRITFYANVNTTVKSTGGKTLTLDNGSSPATITVAGPLHAITTAVALASDLTVATMGGSDLLSMTGRISGAHAVTKSGAGTLILGNANNNFSGGTTLSAGTLQLSSPAALGSGGLAVLGGTLDLHGNSPNSLPSFNGSGGVITDNAASPSGTSTLSVNLASGVSTYSGVIKNGATRNVALVKAGDGTLALGGANVYSGGTTVSAGTLQVTNRYALPAGGSLTIGAGGGMAFQDGLAQAADFGGLSISDGPGMATGLDVGRVATGAAAAPQSVPEPGTLALLAGGAIVLLTWRSRANASGRTRWAKSREPG
jgi:fibronectin-binding autotransporter adhesin